jgi:hypothetical protein
VNQQCAVCGGCGVLSGCGALSGCGVLSGCGWWLVCACKRVVSMMLGASSEELSLINSQAE